MPTHRLSAFAAAPPDRVYALWTSLERMPEWVQGVTKVSDITGPVSQPGTRYITWFGPIKSPTLVLEADPPRRFSTRFGNWLLRGVNTTTFEPDGDGTRIVEVMQTTGWVSAVTSRLFSMGSYKGSYQGELDDFANLAGREASAAGSAAGSGAAGGTRAKTEDAP
jgi:uncharacterized protein YndB with AHSA1/START domain